ncbi:hypothetical protein [Nesterenkonia pannonica]|uniref:hypothetical protein n=1 Tax=Nesterenkonia pannonica TaxID=1548602 RepID=UPI002164E593|nr:hypothetical protein [Nesterenkonia pannonica]
MRIYNALCSYLEARADYFRRPDPEPPEPQPEGAMAQVEHAGQYERGELDQDAPHRDQSEIFEDQAHRRRPPPIGFGP